MSIECYYRDCKHHDKEEPFCGLDECVATEEEFVEFRKARRSELEKMYKENPHLGEFHPDPSC